MCEDPFVKNNLKAKKIATKHFNFFTRDGENLCQCLLVFQHIVTPFDITSDYMSVSLLDRIKKKNAQSPTGSNIRSGSPPKLKSIVLWLKGIFTVLLEICLDVILRDKASC